MENLKRCPFCGGKAEIVFKGKWHVNLQKERQMFGFVIAKCVRCGASAKAVYCDGEVMETSLEETSCAIKAANAWNERVDPCDNCALMK